jgi:hypothetical protein
MLVISTAATSFETTSASIAAAFASSSDCCRSFSVGRTGVYVNDPPPALILDGLGCIPEGLLLHDILLAAATSSVFLFTPFACSTICTTGTTNMKPHTRKYMKLLAPRGGHLTQVLPVWP